MFLETVVGCVYYYVCFVLCILSHCIVLKCIVMSKTSKTGHGPHFLLFPLTSLFFFINSVYYLVIILYTI